MKKLIALTISTSLILSSAVAFADTSAKNLSLDAVSKATGTYTETPAPKPTTPVKTTTPVKVTTPLKVVTPVKVTTPVKMVTPIKVVTPVTSKPVYTYKNGIYVTWGNAYSKGTEGAKVTITNGKVADLTLMRSSQKMIDNDPSKNYKEVWSAYEPMKQRLLGKTQAEAAKVDTVSGATRSSEGWKIAVDRAFTRALNVKPADQTYFPGEHMGVDSQGKYMVFAKFDKTHLVGVKAYVFDPAKGSIIETPAALSQAQAIALSAGINELSYNGKDAKVIVGFEKETAALYAAFADAEKNANVNYQSKYMDGFYSAYSTARTNGIERADVYIKNDQLVDVKLYRLGADLKDRGTTAYPAVVTANAPMTAKFLEKGTSINYFNAAIDGVSGATQSSSGWNQSIERAFTKALKTPVADSYFDGTFAGVDNKSMVLLNADFAQNKVTKIMTYFFAPDGKLIIETALTADQKQLRDKFNLNLLKDGDKMPLVVAQTDLSKAAIAAYNDLLANASTKQGIYKDGVYTTYGHTYDKGTNQAVVTLRNGTIVGLKIARVGQNLIDRGPLAYAEVVKFLPTFLTDFINAGNREAVQKVTVATVDAITGATATGDGLKNAIDYAYLKAEINEAPKFAFINDVFPGNDAAKSIYVMTTIEKNIPVKVQVYFLDTAGKVLADTALSADQLAVRTEIQQPITGALHKYAYKAVAFGNNDEQKVLSAKVIEAINASLLNGAK